MAFNKQQALKHARQDMAKRLSLAEDEIEGEHVEETEFPDLALGASTKGEMSGQMLTPGWRIKLRSGNQTLEYRANEDQLRLHNYKGKNHKVK